mgnify:CR=1 FL=1
MQEPIWINGQVMPLADARIGIEDRGFQFADGVYEVIRIYGGRPFTLDEHLQRLERSSEGIRLPSPSNHAALKQASLAEQIGALVRRSGVRDGMVYLQYTRGSSPRNHVFPTCEPTLLFYVRRLPPVAEPGQAAGLRLISVPDERWKRCWVKSIALLPNVLAKNAAIDAGADEAVFVDDGIVSECSTSNLFAVIGGSVVTHPVGPRVLPGITRLLVLDAALRLGIHVEQRPLLEREALAAEELFLTSTTREIGWVTQWNGRGFAACGPVTLRLHRALREAVKQATGS